MDINILEPYDKNPIYNFPLLQSNIGCIIQRLSSSYVPTKGMHSHSFWEVFVVQKGAGRHIIDFNEFEISSNQVFFLRPGQLHQIFLNTEIQGHLIMFDNDFFDSMLINQLTFSLFTPSLFSINSFMANVIHQLSYLIQHKPSFFKEQLQAAIKLLLLEFANAQNNNMYFKHKCVYEFFELISLPVLFSRFLKDYAAEICLSTNYLNECVKRDTGRPSQFWIKERVLLQSKRLLIHTDKSVVEIANDLNFYDAASFCRFFHSKLNISPHKWRQLYKI